MTDTAGLRGPDKMLFSVTLFMAADAQRVKGVRPVSYTIIVRSGVFRKGATDKPLLTVAVRASERLGRARPHDRQSVIEVVTVRATRTIIIHVFSMGKRYRTCIG